MAVSTNARTPWVAFVCTFLVAASGSAAVFVLGGSDVEALRVAVRGTARAAAVVFAVTFAAGPLYVLRPSPLTRWLRTRRRTLGVCFGALHFCHLGTLVALHRFGPSPFERSAGALIGGGLAYALIALMVLTSTDAAVRRLGRNWRRLHTLGGYYVWLLFTRSYLLPVVRGEWSYVPVLALFVGVLGLRIAARRVAGQEADASGQAAR